MQKRDFNAMQHDVIFYRQPAAGRYNGTQSHICTPGHIHINDENSITIATFVGNHTTEAIFFFFPE